jgi:hypothetical protein
MRYGIAYLLGVPFVSLRFVFEGCQFVSDSRAWFSLGVTWFPSPAARP